MVTSRGSCPVNGSVLISFCAKKTDLQTRRPGRLGSQSDILPRATDDTETEELHACGTCLGSVQYLCLIPTQIPEEHRDYGQIQAYVSMLRGRRKALQMLARVTRCADFFPPMRSVKAR